MLRHPRVDRSSAVVGVAAAMLLIAGCATNGGAPGTGATGATPATSGSATASPTPTAACPMQPGVELPPECAPYDPESAMAQNDAYRERMPWPGDDPVAVAATAEDVRGRLEVLRSIGAWPEDAVRAELEDAGLTDVQTRSGAGDVLFGAVPAGGGCVFGAVEAERVTVEVGGYILDGGCLPAQ